MHKIRLVAMMAATLSACAPEATDTPQQDAASVAEPQTDEGRAEAEQGDAPGLDQPEWARYGGEATGGNAAGDFSLTFGCFERENGFVGSAQFLIMPQNQHYRAIRPGRIYDVAFVVDGRTATTRRVHAVRQDDDAGQYYSLQDISYMGSLGDYSLAELTGDLAQGQTLVVEMPDLGLHETISLRGAASALNDIYLICDGHPTGTGIVG